MVLDFRCDGTRTLGRSEVMAGSLSSILSRQIADGGTRPGPRKVRPKGRPDPLLGQQDDRARGLAALQIAVRLGGLGQRVVTTDGDRDRSGRDRIQ